MNSPTRIEVDAAIAALDERNERRFNGLERKLDELITRFDERFLRLEERMTRFEERMTRFEERMTRFEERMTRFEGRVSSMETDLRDTRNIALSIKQTVITTAIASVIAIIIGFGAITSSMQTNMLSAFTSGKEDAAMQERIAAQLAKAMALEEQLERRGERMDAMLSDLEARSLNAKVRPAR